MNLYLISLTSQWALEYFVDILFNKILVANVHTLTIRYIFTGDILIAYISEIVTTANIIYMCIK